VTTVQRVYTVAMRCYSLSPSLTLCYTIAIPNDTKIRVPKLVLVFLLGLFQDFYRQMNKSHHLVICVKKYVIPNKGKVIRTSSRQKLYINCRYCQMYLKPLHLGLFCQMPDYFLFIILYLPNLLCNIK